MTAFAHKMRDAGVPVAKSRLFTAAAEALQRYESVSGAVPSFAARVQTDDELLAALFRETISHEILRLAHTYLLRVASDMKFGNHDDFGNQKSHVSDTGRTSQPPAEARLTHARRPVLLSVDAMRNATRTVLDTFMVNGEPIRVVYYHQIDRIVGGNTLVNSVLKTVQRKFGKTAVPNTAQIGDLVKAEELERIIDKCKSK